eukprot:TRINITY_DN5044_c0_g1_i7.p1 TRINITY_DN5044_c0_g1~~TRINITY_DN5044_c0_g1_i7.p1  ORF type:complete len:110 (+),score=28.68 TRINITY_DN5044_c0_g1_i7:90-419(+)
MEKDPTLRNKPLFFTGLSMGAAASIYLALKEPDLAKGMILFSPSISVESTLIPGAFLIKKLAPLFRPFKRRGLTSVSDDLMSDSKELVDKMVKDPLVYTGKFPYCCVWR